MASGCVALLPLAAISWNQLWIVFRYDFFFWTQVFRYDQLVRFSHEVQDPTLSHTLLANGHSTKKGATVSLSFFHTWGRNSYLASLFVVTDLLSKYDFVEVTKWKTCNVPAPKASMLSVSAFSLWDMDDSSPCFSLLLRSTQNTVSSIKGMFNLVWQIMHADSSRLSDSSSTKIFLRCMKSKLCFHPWKSGSSANWYTPVISPN